MATSSLFIIFVIAIIWEAMMSSSPDLRKFKPGIRSLDERIPAMRWPEAPDAAGTPCLLLSSAHARVAMECKTGLGCSLNGEGLCMPAAAETPQRAEPQNWGHAGEDLSGSHLVKLETEWPPWPPALEMLEMPGAGDARDARVEMPGAGDARDARVEMPGAGDAAAGAGDARVDLNGSARERFKASSDRVMGTMMNGIDKYGVTTGFGAASHRSAERFCSFPIHGASLDTWWDPCPLLWA